MKIINLNHLKEQRMTYFQHFAFAIDVFFKLIFAGLALLVHAFIPFLFPTVASEILKNIEKKMKLMK